MGFLVWGGGGVWLRASLFELPGSALWVPTFSAAQGVSEGGLADHDYAATGDITGAGAFSAVYVQARTSTSSLPYIDPYYFLTITYTKAQPPN